MSELNSLGYIGAITGVIGAVTGIAGAIMGYIGYRRSEQSKALDLRLELRKSERSLVATVEEILPLLEHAKKSRMAVSSARGQLKSDYLKNWLAEWDEDHESARALEKEMPERNATYASLSHAALESKLVEVHALQIRADKLKGKYVSEVASDDKERAEIKEDIRVRTQASLERK